VRGAKVEYPAYLVKRICRIYLPYLAALIVALVGCFFFHGLNGYDSWFRLTWSASPSWALVRQHILFVGDYDVSAYNTAFWSLVQEMRISIFFPVLCFAIIRLRVVGSILAAASLVAASMYFDSRSWMPSTYSQTASCTSIFIVGILISLYLQKLQAWLSSLPRAVWWSLLSACLFLYIYSPLVGYHLHLAKPITGSLLALGSGGLILFSLSAEQIGRVLMGSAISFLGRVSYSIYLLHGTVLFAFAYIFHGRVSPLVWFVPYVGITLGAAKLFYRFVELPSIRLGKMLASKVGLRPSDPGLPVILAQAPCVIQEVQGE
jgi:peptidoglycan/LPS O-acetylase OafA/YrhL